MIINRDKVAILLSAEFPAPHPGHDTLTENQRLDRIAGIISDTHNVPIDAADLHVTRRGDRFYWYGWNPGQRPSELHYGIADGRIENGANHMLGVNVVTYDTEQKSKRVVTGQHHYQFAGWNTITRRWVLTLEGKPVIS